MRIRCQRIIYRFDWKCILADRHHHKKDREGAAAVSESQEARGPQEALAGEKNLAFDQLGLSREVLDAVA